MSEIETFPFSQEGIGKIKSYKYGKNWPVVYLLENGKEMYVGETVRAHSRAKQHMDNKDRQRLHTIHLISDDEFNKSAALDIESSLIEFMVADQKFKIQNGNGGLQNHDYYDRALYQSKFEVLWEELREMGLVNREWSDIKNSDLFKYSPYKTLTDDQYLIVQDLLEEIKTNGDKNFVVSGGPGTGKTIVATFLLKQLVDQGIKNVALVIAMTALRNTLKKVFRSIPGLSAKMVVGPSEAAVNSYEVLLVDEAHRLRRRKNIPNYGTHDTINKKLGLDKEGDELDWLVQSTKKLILFYDAKQSVRPSDVLPKKIHLLDAKKFALQTQMRVAGGQKYIDHIDSLLEGDNSQKYKAKEYDFKIFDNFTRFIAAVKHQEKQHTLSRMVAGYAWEWASKKDVTKHDIEIEGHKLFWNSRLTDWVNSPNAPEEVGCIHTIQGYDLNYAGVIIGPELSYDPVKQKLVVYKDKYKDTNGHRGVNDPEELKRYVINIYKTLLTRGVLGTYVYIVDQNLRDYFAGEVRIAENDSKKILHSPYQEYVEVPLYDSIGCGEAMMAETIANETVEVQKEFIKPGAKYFALRTRGDSMNKIGIKDGDTILCQKNYQASDGSIAVVMMGDSATLKKIKYQRDGLLLIPQSTNPEHKESLLGEDDDFKVLGTFIRVVD